MSVAAQLCSKDEPTAATPKVSVIKVEIIAAENVESAEEILSDDDNDDASEAVDQPNIMCIAIYKVATAKDMCTRCVTGKVTRQPSSCSVKRAVCLILAGAA